MIKAELELETFQVLMHNASEKYKYVEHLYTQDGSNWHVKHTDKISVAMKVNGDVIKEMIDETGLYFHEYETVRVKAMYEAEAI